MGFGLAFAANVRILDQRLGGFHFQISEPNSMLAGTSAFHTVTYFWVICSSRHSSQKGCPDAEGNDDLGPETDELAGDLEIIILVMAVAVDAVERRQQVFVRAGPMEIESASRQVAAILQTVEAFGQELFNWLRLH